MLEIPTAGVFPAPSTDAESNRDVTWLEQVGTGGFHNYSSITDARDDAMAEISRLTQLGFCTKLSKVEAMDRFPRGVVSKLALLIKQKADGSVKRRIIVDLLRSGANAQARAPERILLPRIG
eukprot:999166-Amphidinium_carterae.1